MPTQYFSFLKQLPKSFTEIGALVPSSPALAKKMTKLLNTSSSPRKILEVGPGTGPFTKQILKSMTDKDSLTICEINPQFIKYLKTNLEKNKDYLKHKSRVEFFQAPVQDLKNIKQAKTYDVIISSLPFTHFPALLVQEILDLYLYLSTDSAHISFFQYAAGKKIVSLLSSEEEKKRLKEVAAVIDNWLAAKDAKIEKDFTLLNIPPAFSLHYSKTTP